MVKTSEAFGEHADPGGLVKNKYPSESDKTILKRYRLMREGTYEDCQKFLETHDHVVIENVKIPLLKKHEITRFAPTILSLSLPRFGRSLMGGDWATHNRFWRWASSSAKYHQDAMKDEIHERKMERGRYDFLLIAHGHLHVFRKPGKNERLSPFKESTKW